MKTIDILKKLIELIRKLIGKESPITIEPGPGPPKPIPPSPPEPVDSPYFNFFEKQKFLTFVSYFNGIDAKFPEQDLDFLKSKGVDGVRLYLNFSYPPNRPWNFIFNPDGSLNPYKLGTLGHILRLAEEREMVVDISSSRRGGRDEWQMPFGTYAHAWRLLSIELKKWAEFKNYLIDIENEHNCPWAGISETMNQYEALKVREAIQTNLPDVPITASVACNISPEAAATWADNEGMTFIGYHDPRVQGWAEATEELALRCKRAVGDNSVKICFQEPTRSAQSTNEFRVALEGAKRAEIAGWCFHNDIFTLSDGSFESKLNPAGKEFLNQL